MFNVAFIDDGIDNIHLNDLQVAECIKLYDDGDCGKQQGNLLNHGTICALVFEKYLVNKNVNIFDLRISHFNHLGMLPNLLSALRWCINHSIDLISISVGTINQFAFQPIREVIKLVLDKGIIIVAAMDNGNRYSMPACLHGVVGVRASTDYIDGNYAFRWHPFDGIEIVASGKQILRSNRGSIHITSCKNSFAAPVITAYIADIIQKYGTKSYNEILAYLSKKASHVVGEYISDKCLYYWDSVYKEDIYNWDKEAYSKAVKEYIKYKNIDITSPLISISGDNYAKTRELIIDLVSFAAKYYTYIVVSSDFIDVDRNIILPDLCDGQIFINNLFDLYRPDLLIANIPYSINSDLEIEINESIVLSYQVGDDYASETYGFADFQIIERVFSILS